MAVPPSFSVSVGTAAGGIDRDVLAHGQRIGNGLAGVEVAARRRLRNCADHRCHGVDLRAALGQAGERQVGGIAGTVGDGGGVEIDRGGGEGGGVLAGADGVAEGQRAGAGAAAIGRGAAVVERERRGAAGNGDRLAQVQRQRDGLAGIKVAARGRFHNRRDGRARRGSRRYDGIDDAAVLTWKMPSPPSRPGWPIQSGTPTDTRHFPRRWCSSQSPRSGCCHKNDRQQISSRSHCWWSPRPSHYWRSQVPRRWYRTATMYWRQRCRTHP